jgi:hypothetical protein
MHYRTSGVHGSVIANKVAHYVVHQNFDRLSETGPKVTEAPTARKRRLARDPPRFKNESWRFLGG